MPELERFIDAWGSKPDEWFVCEADHSRGTYGLAHTAGGRITTRVLASALAYPDGKKAERYYIADMVRTS